MSPFLCSENHDDCHKKVVQFNFLLLNDKKYNENVFHKLLCSENEFSFFLPESDVKIYLTFSREKSLL